MVGLAESRWAPPALKTDGNEQLTNELSKVEQGPEEPQTESNESENANNSGCLGFPEQRNTNPVTSTGLESQSQNNQLHFQRPFPRQANSTANVGLAGPRWTSAPALPPSAPQPKRRARREEPHRRNTNQAMPAQSMAAEINQSSKAPSNTSRAEAVQQP